MNKYFGSFSNREDVSSNFSSDSWGRPHITPEDFPTEGAILFASYGGTSYEGDALVIFVQDGKLFEVHGSHCSCYGLEGQWAPEETSWAALGMRNLTGYEMLADHDNEAVSALAALLTEQGQTPIVGGRYD